ncbi:hypothetical protein T484DRAFT_1765344, partial [Baffinella frigidus]
RKRFSEAIALLKKAEMMSTGLVNARVTGHADAEANCVGLAGGVGLRGRAMVVYVDFTGRIGLRGWTMDLLAHYYFARKKMSAALHYMYKAMTAIDQFSSTRLLVPAC